MPEIPSKLSRKELVFCNHCKSETNHVCQAEYRRERDFGIHVWEETLNRLWICAGCETAVLEICYIHPGFGAPENYDSQFFPRRNEHEAAEKYFQKLPAKLYKIYRETVRAYNDGLNVLCAAGLRALMEGICADKGVTGRNLKRKINALVGQLPASIVSNLHSLRFIGNTALHELNPPSRETLGLAIEVVGDLMNFMYELDYKTNRLSQHLSPAKDKTK